MLLRGLGWGEIAVVLLIALIALIVLRLSRSSWNLRWRSPA